MGTTSDIETIIMLLANSVSCFQCFDSNNLDCKENWSKFVAICRLAVDIDIDGDQEQQTLKITLDDCCMQEVLASAIWLLSST